MDKTKWLSALLGSVLVLGGCVKTTDMKTQRQATTSGIRVAEGKIAVQLNTPHLQLHLGEALALGYSSGSTGYANLYALNSSGKTMQLMANHPVYAGVWQTFPSHDAAFTLTATPPAGVERYVLLVTQVPFNPLLPQEAQDIGGVSQLTLATPKLRQRLAQATASLRPESWGKAESEVQLVTP